MTNKTAWTPGPWARNISSRYPIYQNETHAKIAACLVDSAIPEDEREANLKLITLAPEMAEALREIEDTADCAAGCHDDVMQDALKECRALARSILSRLPVAK